MNKYSEKEIEHLWETLEDVSTIENEEGKLVLGVDWLIFSKGTELNEIWIWFDHHYPKGVSYLYEYV